MSSIVQPLYVVDNSATGFSFAESVDPATGVVDTSAPVVSGQTVVTPGTIPTITVTAVASPTIASSSLLTTLTTYTGTVETWIQNNMGLSLGIAAIVAFFMLGSKSKGRGR